MAFAIGSEVASCSSGWVIRRCRPRDVLVDFRFVGASVLRVAQIIDSRTARLLPCRATRLETSSRRICRYQDAPGAARVGSPKAGPLVSAEGLKVLDEYFARRRQ
jgi:hypothetical protein